ncbi:sensor histidine kinase [Pseudomonas indica]|uniref:Two-component system, LytT family, sensor histidine kinase AlgZ n=1 Tax=Pseudomonas indica TaxID=137658 RepID=A0A1G8TAP3_9PSED|nr:sensor histidine kinase [Pseudomonas indica]MBU3055673.1 sensor histidine kinase [Pseudomonas indica]PAU56095.1 alginate O-acetyltransferase [Pseudomonas indica]SDJ38551.1 two-component system, LytT family, sensor histidine kinase AlgZ [Pseudomonas indica]
MRIDWFKNKQVPLLDDDFFLPELCLPEALLSMVLLAELLVLVLVLSEPMQPDFNWVRLALTSLFVQWIVLLSAALLCRLRPQLARLRPWLAGACCSAIVVGLTLACTAVADYFQLAGPLQRSGEVNLYLRHALIGLIMSALLLRYFYLQSQWRRQQQAELRARIESLQARIRPHFLFNSLNSIASLIAFAPEKAEQAVLDLSDLFRASLAKPGTLVSWRDELELAKRYLSIEQYRLGDRLQLEWQIDDVPDDLPIPQLTLQPLLENALIYGIQPRIEGGLVRVEASYMDGVFQLRVSNPYDEGATAATSRGTRQALVNIDARLAALFGPRASLSVDRRDGRHFTCLRYPCARLTQEARAI